jgi:hypothetical protein
MSKIKLPIDNAPSTNVQYAYESLVAESLVLTNLVQPLKQFFPTMINDIKDKLSAFSNLPALMSFDLDKSSFVLNEIVKHDFIDYGEIKVMVPEGFNGQYILYYKDLEKILLQSINIIDEVITPFTNLVGSFISNRESKTSVQDLTSFYNKIQANREEKIKILGQYFTDGSHNSLNKVNKVISRGADLKEVAASAKLIEKLLKQINIKLIMDSTKKCVDILDLIIKRLSENKIENISPEVNKNLANGSFQVAEELQFLAVSYFKAEQYIACINDLNDRLAKIIKNI